MPAYRPTLNRHLRYAVLPVLLLGLSGCAGTGMHAPASPDESVLAPAQQALSSARDVNADRYAPREIDAARRRITVARDILFSAARADRKLSRDEHQRVQALVRGAQLDARAARVQSQAKTTAEKIAQLQAKLNPQPAASAAQHSQASGSRAQHSPLNPQPDSHRRSVMDRHPQNDHQAPLGPQRRPAQEARPGRPESIGQPPGPMNSNHMGMP